MGASHTAPSTAGHVWGAMLLGLQKALFTTVIPVNAWHGLTTNAEPMLQLLCRFFCSPTWQNLLLEVRLIGTKTSALWLLKSWLNAIVKAEWKVLIAYCTVMDRANLIVNLTKDARGR